MNVEGKNDLTVEKRFAKNNYRREILYGQTKTDKF